MYFFSRCAIKETKNIAFYNRNDLVNDDFELAISSRMLQRAGTEQY
jgi:hypothetical protein